jgi:acyl-CoA thioesterase
METTAASQFAKDACARSLGITLVGGEPGRAVLRMVVRPDMVNGHGTCHGGIVFTLADAAFAVACNAYRLASMAAAASVEFLAPAPLGATLTATCIERTRPGRTGVYDADVVADDGTVIAVFRGRSRTVPPSP